MVVTEYSWMSTEELVDFVALSEHRTGLEIEMAQRLSLACATEDDEECAACRQRLKAG